MVVEYDGTEDNEDLSIDEAHITLGKTEDVPFFLTGGKIYAPFGDFSTNMIQIRSPSPWARSTARV